MRSLELVVAPAPSTGSYRSSSGGSKAAATNSADNEWGPFRNATTCGADMALVLGILLCAFVLGLVFMASVKVLLCRRGGTRSPSVGDTEKPGGKGGAGWEGPTTLYAEGETELAGAAAECAICLTEFAEGDALSVLPACRHGFHVECVETWLASSTAPPMGAPPSCPVCRASCRPRECSPLWQP